MTTDFPSLKNEPIEVRLSAYLDGQTSDEESAELEQMIAEDDATRALFDQLTLGSEIGNKAFDEMLREPVPLHLVRAIKDAGSKTNVRIAANSQPANGRSNLFSFVPRAIAASAVLLLAGGYTGFVIGNQPGMKAPTEISELSGFDAAPAAGNEGTKTRSFDMGEATKGFSGLTSDMQLANQWQAFQARSTDIGLIAADDKAGLARTLGQAAGVTFTVPDLADEGYTLAGGRLIANGAHPMAGLFYRDAGGELLIIGYGMTGTKEPLEDRTGEVMQVGDATVAKAIRKDHEISVIGQANLQHVDTLRDKAIEAF